MSRMCDGYPRAAKLRRPKAFPQALGRSGAGAL